MTRDHRAEMRRLVDVATEVVDKLRSQGYGRYAVTRWERIA